MKMQTLILATSLLLLAATPVAAAESRPHALGDMYTDALNFIGSRGMLDTIEPKKQVKVTDIHMDHGQVFVTVAGDSGSTIFTYDPLAHALVPPEDKAAQ